MLSVQENQRLTQVGKGTPGGELMRRYWMPALLSSELPMLRFGVLVGCGSVLLSFAAAILVAGL